jgi:hypothetical protein
VSVPWAVQYLKGKSSHKASVGVSIASQALLGSTFLGRGYWVATSGKVTYEVWKKYIEDQKPEVPDDHFNVVQQVGPRGRPNPAFSRNPKPPPLGGGESHQGPDAGTGFRECASRRGVTCAPRQLEWRLIGLPGFKGEVRDPSRRRASPHGWPLVLQSDYSFHFEFKMTSQKLTRLYFGSRNSSTSALTLPKVVSGFWIVPLAKASIMPFLKPCPRG